MDSQMNLRDSHVTKMMVDELQDWVFALKEESILRPDTQAVWKEPPAQSQLELSHR